METTAAAVLLVTTVILRGCEGNLKNTATLSRLHMYNVTIVDSLGVLLTKQRCISPLRAQNEYTLRRMAPVWVMRLKKYNNSSSTRERFLRLLPPIVARKAIHTHVERSKGGVKALELSKHRAARGLWNEHGWPHGFVSTRHHPYTARVDVSRGTLFTIIRSPPLPNGVPINGVR